jgi:cytidylate kinase
MIEGNLMATDVSKPDTSTQQNRIVLCICGMAGTGKSTQAKRIAQKYGLRYFSGGDALRVLAAEKGYNSASNGWWESPEGLSFLEQRKANPNFDKLADQKLLQYAEEGNVLLDSWTMPWLVKGGFKIWLAASVEKQAERIAKRDKMGAAEALEALKAKEARTKAIYKQLYGFALGEDFSPFNLILDTDNLDAEAVFEVLSMVIDNVVLAKAEVSQTAVCCQS